MPWTEKVPMQRLDFIRACEAGTHSISELCRLHGISRKTGYKWLNRFDPGDVDSLKDRSHARLTQPEKIPADVAPHFENQIRNAILCAGSFILQGAIAHAPIHPDEPIACAGLRVSSAHS